MATVSTQSVSERGWFYLDNSERKQGPFTTNEMDLWNQNGYLQENLPLSWHQDSQFVSLAEFRQRPSRMLSQLHSHKKSAYEAVVLSSFHPVQSVSLPAEPPCMFDKLLSLLPKQNGAPSTPIQTLSEVEHCKAVN